MFKIGDKIICIEDSDVRFLELNNIYTILDIDIIYAVVYIKNENNFITDYNIERFISLKEYRKQKLQKICSNQVIK